MFKENLKHKGIYHKSLNVMIPGVLPPKEVNPDVHFMESYNNFDPASLTHEQLVAVAEDDSHLSGADIGETYTVDGLTYPLPSPPIKERLERVREFVSMYSSKIKRCESLWRKDITKQYLYDNTRSALSSGIRYKTLLYILEMRDKTILPSEREKEEDDYRRYKRAWDRENERQAGLHNYWKKEDPHRSVHEKYPFKWKDQ